MILVSGVRRRGTQLAATPRHVIDRPELSQRTVLPAPHGADIACALTALTTEYPANGSSRLLTHAEEEEKWSSLTAH